MLADTIWIFLFVCSLLIIGDNSEIKEKKKNLKKKCRQTKKRITLNNCFSTIFIFFLSHCKYFVRFYLLSCKERSVEQKGAGSIKSNEKRRESLHCHCLYRLVRSACIIGYASSTVLTCAVVISVDLPTVFAV